MPFKTPVGDVKVNQTAPTFLRPLQDKRVIVGQSVNLECQVDGHPDPVIKWLKDGQNVTQCPDYEMSQKGKSYVLHIPSVQGADCGRFTIQAMNAAGIKQSTCILIVAPAPTPIPGAASVASSPAPPMTPVGPSAPFFIKELRNQLHKPGGVAVLETRVVGVPVPSVEWLKDGLLLNNYRISTEYDSQSGIALLTIPQLFPEDLGEYSCRATNDMGTTICSAFAWGVSESETEPELANLNRREFAAPGAPPIFRNELRDLKLTEGTDAILQCTLSGNPKPQIYWLKNGRILEVYGLARIQFSYKGSTAMLKIVEVSPADDGDYRIIAENAFGKAESSARIQVFALRPPEPQNPQFPTKSQTAAASERRPIQSVQPIAPPAVQLPSRSVPQPPQRQSAAPPPNTRPEYSVALPQQQQQPTYSVPTQRNQPASAVVSQNAYSVAPPSQPAFSVAPPPQPAYSVAPPSQPAYSTAPQPTYPQSRAPPPSQQPTYSVAAQQPQHQHSREPPKPPQRPQKPTAPTQPVYSIASAPPQPPTQPSQRQPEFHYAETLQLSPPIPPPRDSVASFIDSQLDYPHYSQPLPRGFRSSNVERAFEAPQEHYYSAPVVASSPPSSQQYPSARENHQRYLDQRPSEAIEEFLNEGAAQFVHPYLRRPQQVEYEIQQRQQRMAPPTQPKANGGVAGSGGPQPQFTQMPQSVAVGLGESPKFTATAVGQPTPQLEWRRNGKPLASGPKYQITGKEGKSELTIAKIADADLGAYVCAATNSAGVFQAQFQVAKGQSANAEFQTKIPGTTALNEGDSTQIAVRAPKDTKQIEWNRDGVPIKSEGNYKIENRNGGESVLSIANVTMSDGGWLECRATGPSGVAVTKGRLVVRSRKNFEEPAERERVTLRKVDRSKQFQRPRAMDDQPPPSREAPKFLTPLKSMTLNEGQHALLDCKFSPTEDPNLKIAWQLNGKPLVSSSRITTLFEFGYAVLEINPVTVFDHGEYTIIAINQLGEIRQSAVVEVLGNRSDSVMERSQREASVSVPTPSPRSLIDRPNFHKDLRSQELFEGQILHLETKLTPINDPNLRVQFFLNGNPVTENDRTQIQIQSGFVVLTISDVSQSDAGYYTCEASNDAGTAETDATVIVVPKQTFMESSQILDVDDAREMEHSFHAGLVGAPKFVQPLQDFHCEYELGRSYFEARIEPVSDPTLRVSWLKDGQSLANANRIQTVNNFGFLSLTIHPTYAEDAGVYSCVLNNDFGESRSEANLTTIASETLHLETFHDNALPQINDIEGFEVHIGPLPTERPEEISSLEAPSIVRQLDGHVQVQQDDPVHFECRVQPANDVKMNVSWLHNGAPLAAAHRFRPMFDFGYVALDILYAYPEDSGTYTMIAENELGKVECNVELEVIGHETLYLDPQHPEGLDRITELEQPKNFGIAEVPDRETDVAPKFLGDLHDMEVPEHDDILFDLKVTPINDPTMEVEWLWNGAPLQNASRFRPLFEFGFVQLRVNGVIAEDSGTFTVIARNSLGEDRRECVITVVGEESILSATQHADALGKIEYLENLNKYAREEVVDFEAETGPQFVQSLPADVGEIEEGEPLHLECRVEPVGDNSLTIQWLHNGHPLPHAHRFRTFHDFGFVSLDILHVYAEDSGEFTCVAENGLGRAETVARLSCSPKNGILSDTQHPASVARIEELEAPKLAAEEAPEADKQAPFFTKPPEGPISASESDNIFLEALVGPADDNTLTHEWLLNGQPLQTGHRFISTQDFGFIALNILYIYPEDSGTYTLVVRNAAGEVSADVEIQCEGKESMLTDTFHPSAIERITELEAPRPQPDEQPDAERSAPQITKQLEAVPLSQETQSVHLDAQFLPIDDNTLQIQWFRDGQPLPHSNRYQLSNDFGFAALDINFLVAADAGEYTLVVSNDLGEAQTSTSIQIEGSEVIVGDTNHPESLRRIQELEMIRPAEPTEEESPPEPPQFTQQLTASETEDLVEGQPLHMDCTVLPINDPRLRIEWFFNGQPLQFSSRLRTIHDFGYVALEFLHIHPEDSGTYTCRAINEAGEAETSLTLECLGKKNIYLESQHEESWQKIQELENRPDLREPSPELVFPPPNFTQNLQNAEDLIEGDAVRLECRLQPVNDPTLKVHWTCNGNPLPEANRFRHSRNMDLIVLDVPSTMAEDSGVYTCHAVSNFGEAATSATLKIQPTDALLLDTQHQQSWDLIQEMENRQPIEPIVPEIEIVAPRFVIPLPQLPDFQEGDPIHFEGQIEPTNDNKLTVEWLFNGQPLTNGHRYRTTHDFGYVSLDILYAFAQDSGTYTCVARNELGEAQSESSVQIAPHDILYLDPQHPESWQRIQELEAPKEKPEEAEPEAAAAPQFIEPMESLKRIEGQPAHFQTRVTPNTDPKLTVFWLKDGQPLQNSNRFRFTHDFGLVSLDILHTVSNDVGTYTAVAQNEQGEAQVEAQLEVEEHGVIFSDPQNPNSWQRVQELEAPKEKPEEAADAEFSPPHFTQQLQSVEDLIEGQPAHFEAFVEPTADPRLHLQWFHNGRPLPASNRFAMRNDFGLVSLDIHYVLAQDIGDYRCVATNDYGEDSTEAHLDCQKRPSLLLDPQHEESWRRIQELEAPREAAPEAEPVVYAAPQFTQPLQSQSEIPEGSTVVFEARVIPVNDPDLQIQWFLDDQPLRPSNRHAITSDFGHVALRIIGATSFDNGVYSCKAVNKEGAAITNASLSVGETEGILGDTAHPTSLQKIQQLEGIDKFPHLEYPEMEFSKPVWVQTFENINVDDEGGVIQLEGYVDPADDPNLRVEWSLNGVPLQNSNRHRCDLNFGRVVLSIVHVLPHDSGVYTCRAYNDHGDATTSSTVKVAGYEALLLDTQHPTSWEQIQILEAPRIVEEVEMVEEKEKPRFLVPLADANDIPEGTPIKLEATFQPARDNDLRVEWLFNGEPLGASQLIRTRNELGWACLDISAVNPDHNGVFTLRIVNTEGEAATSATVKIAGIGEILGETTHEESWRQIQELEAPKPKEPTPPPPEFDPPSIQTEIADVECSEGDPSAFEAVIQPTNDPNLKVEWIRNGELLSHGSKFAISQDFGLCKLGIGYTFPEDEGVFQLRISNASGEAVSSATLKCQPKEAILGDVQHEESWRRIQEIEAPKEPAPEVEPPPKTPPKFTAPLQNVAELSEGQPAHFETTVEPIDDPELQIQWFFNGEPFAASSRAKMINDFGWIIMNINSVDSRDSGEWTCVATNSLGEDRVSTTLNVSARGLISEDAINAQSLARIEQLEAPKAAPEEAEQPAAEAPQITLQLSAPDGLEEGDSAHLEAHYTPTNDPKLKVCNFPKNKTF